MRKSGKPPEGMSQNSRCRRPISLANGVELLREVVRGMPHF